MGYRHFRSPALAPQRRLVREVETAAAAVAGVRRKKKKRAAEAEQNGGPLLRASAVNDLWRTVMSQAYCAGLQL
jgi:hypothetical protein